MREIDKLLKNLLTQYGFVLKKNSWYRLTKDFIQIINFQKSQFSNKYYLNIGIDEKSDNMPLFKPEYMFAIRLRADNIVSDSTLIHALDFEKYISEDERVNNINTTVLCCIHFLDSITDWKQLKSAFEDNAHLIHQAFITISFKQCRELTGFYS